MPDPHDVFLSYNSSDRPAARAILARLKEQGFVVFLDERDLVAGQNFIPRLESALLACKSVAILMGPRGLGKWQQIEKDLALDRKAKEPNLPVIPVLLPGDVDPPTGFLSLNTWIDLRGGVEAADGIARLTAALRNQPPPGTAFNPRNDVCPYRGLLPFREEDREYYFGREPDVAALVKLVREDGHPVVPVIGSSGSGKSSLVYAGLIPELRNPAHQADRTPWEILTLRPLTNPLASLMEALSPPPEDLDRAQRIARLNESTELLRAGKVRLSQLVDDVLKGSGGCQRLLLFVDQWEELYSQIPRDVPEAERKKAEADRILFIDSLLEATKNSPCSLVFTVRADFYDPLLGWDNRLKHGKLQDHLNRAGLSLGPMNREALEAAIVKPAQKAGYHFADGLVKVILDEVGLQPGHLPLLEFFLRELWLRRDGDEFTFKGYQDSGGVSGAIARRADEEFAKLLKQGDKKLEEAARRVFVSLVTPGEGREDTRAVIALPESGPERRVVELFSAHDVRLLVAGDGKVEVSHEALIRQWARLQKDWLAKNRDFLRVRDRIRAARDVWDSPVGEEVESGRKEKRRKDRRRSPERLLQRGLPLQEAKTLLKNHGDVIIDDIRDYIRLSLRRDFWRRVRGGVFLTVVTIVAMAVGFGGLVLAVTMSQSSDVDERALEKFNREIYESESKLPPEPPPLQNSGQTSRPLHSYKNRIGMELVWCWPGSFQMGSTPEEPGHQSDETLHPVKLTSGFWMARHETTQNQWKQIMVNNPSFYRWSGQLPVEMVSWNGANTFCEALTTLERETGSIPEGWKYTLPTEAQWEYVCRAGSRAPFSAHSLGDTAWFVKNAFMSTHRVGFKRANRWGLYDMQGNVYEWCLDGYGKYDIEQAVDPFADPRQAAYRVIRGGSWYNFARYCRSANRNQDEPEDRYDFLGFRPVLTLASK